MRGRGLVLAAPASGSGKTLVTAALSRHLRRRGLSVAAAKAGPDFIDPTFHAAATGAPCVNLDVWAMQPQRLGALVAGLEGTAEIVLCEGVMGLFDGTGPEGEAGSTAELALITGWPVVLVVDARRQGASVAALLRGFAEHRRDVPLAGIIFNRVASDRHRALLLGAVTQHLPDLANFGALPADPALVLPSRHLGLVPAGESGASEAAIAHAAELAGAYLDIDRLLRLAQPSRLGVADTAPGIAPLGQHVAVARDDAFGFCYPTLLDRWRGNGADLSFFSPLDDEPPDPAANAVYLPGGYPELYAGRLAAADAFLAGLRRAADDGKPVYGECGGFMVLGETLIDAAGHRLPMAGLLPLVTSFAERRLSLGYRSAALISNGPLGAAGARFRGHEFHYATATREDEKGANPLWSAADAAGIDLGTCGLRRGSVLGSFIHLIDDAPGATRID